MMLHKWKRKRREAFHNGDKLSLLEEVEIHKNDNS